MDPYLKWALVVFALVVVVVFISKLPAARARGCELVPLPVLQQQVAHVKKLATESRQDGNPLMGLIHVTAALSALASLLAMDRSRSLGKKLDVDLEALRVSLRQLQNDKLRQLRTLCPSCALDEGVEWH